MFQKHLFVMVALVALVVPMVPIKANNPPSLQFPGWPKYFENIPLQEIPLSKQELKFEKSFPGRIGKFYAGKRVILIRWVTNETRMLHPITDCFKGLGYQIKSLPLQHDAQKPLYWSTFKAIGKNHSFNVKECIFDEQGNSWTDVSSWYWNAFLMKTKGPWWSIVITESATKNNNQLHEIKFPIDIN